MPGNGPINMVGLILEQLKNWALLVIGKEQNLQWMKTLIDQ